MKSEINTSQWKARIQRSEGMQSKMHREWKDAIDLINCDYFEKNDGVSSERVDVHFANWYYDNLVDLCYYRDPFIFFKSRSDKYTRFAETLEMAVNAKWRDMGMKQEFKDCIGSALIMPPGWIKTGYTAKIGEDVAKQKENKEKGILNTIKDAIKGALSSGSNKEKESATPEEQGVLDIHIKEESVFASWIPSWNVLLPEGYHRVEDMPWIAEWEDVPLVDFQANPMYKNKSNLRGLRNIGTSTDSGGGQEVNKVTFNSMTGGVSTDMSNDDIQVIRLYHVQDRRTQKRFTLSMMSEEPHFEGDWPYDIEGFNLRPLVFKHKIPHIQNSNPYPTNCIKPILPQIIETSQSRTQMARWRRRSGALILAQKGLLNEDDMNQLEESDALQIVYLSNLSGVQMSQTPNLPQGIFDVGHMIQQDLQMGTSMGQTMFAPQKGTRTATQAKIGEGGLQLKISSKQDCVEDLTVIVARDLAQLMWQFYDKKQVEELIGEEVSDDMWPALPEDPTERRRVIQNIQIRIDAGSAAPPKDDTVDRKQTLDMVSILSTIAPERLNKGEVVKQVLKKFKFSKENDKMVYSNDEEEKKAAEEENTFLLQNHPQIVSPNTNHEIHLEVHSQAMAQGGDTAALHAHLLDHAKFLGINPDKGKGGNGGNGGQPQKGDIRPPMQSSNPEIVRQGHTSPGNIMASAQNMGAGSRGAGNG